MKNKLTCSNLIKCLKDTSEAIVDCRNGNNLKYSVSEATFFAFSCFYIQQSSFLRHEKNYKKKIYRQNLKKIFPKHLVISQTARNILDNIEPSSFAKAFDMIFHKLDRSGVLQGLKFSKEFGLLLSADGVDYFYSEDINCINCSVANHQNGRIAYSHKMLAVNIVHPSKNIILPLYPEFIVPQDGNQKQDCEREAAKRWITRFRKIHHLVNATILTDALHCTQPYFEEAFKNKLNVIAVCKEGSNKFLMEWVNDCDEDDFTKLDEKIKIKGKFHKIQYKFLKNVPMKEGEDAIKVTYMSMIEFDNKNKQISKHEYVTTHNITKENVKLGCLAGRKRWKTENEGNNTLKNHGYRFNHNFGHGKKHLSSVLATLIVFAFLIHSILKMLGEDLLGKLLIHDTTQECFAMLRNLLRVLNFTSWIDLYIVMLRSLQKI